MQIKNRRPGLPERGKIKIGAKGAKRTSKGGKEFAPPEKLDHFIVTTLEKDRNDNYVPDTDLMRAIAERTGQSADKLTRLPVRLLYNDPSLNLGTRYAAYNGRTLWCSGDGEAAQRLGQDGTYQTRTCTCEHLHMDGQKGPQPMCKINGVLSVLIDGAPGVGGVWKFRTTSFNSVDGLMGSLSFIAGVTGGQLANIPLDLVLHPKRTALADGTQQTVYVVGLEFRGSVDELRDTGYQIARANVEANLRIEHIEAEARRALEAPAANEVFPGEDADDVTPEFYPDAQGGDGGQEAPAGQGDGGDAPTLVAPEGKQPEPAPEPTSAGDDTGDAAGEPPPSFDPDEEPEAGVFEDPPGAGQGAGGGDDDLF